MRQLMPILLLSAACSSEHRGWLVELHGQVIDENGLGVEGASVLVEAEDQNTVLGEPRTDAEGRWSFPLFVEEGEEKRSWPLRLSAAPDGYVGGESFWDFSWIDDSWPAIPLSLGPGQFVAAGSQKTAAITLFTPQSAQEAYWGSVRNVLDGEPLGQVTLRLRKGWNAPTDQPVLQQVVSDSDGDFSFSVEDLGVYTIEATAPSGYAKSLSVFRVGPGAPQTQLVLMSPPVGFGELRAALVWRNSARDLDLHMSGPLSISSGRYQVYVDDSPHPIYGTPIAQIERTGGRWEVLGLYTMRVGEYRFSAHDVDNQLLLDSTALSESDVSMILWSADGVTLESLFPGAVGTLWRALEYETTSESVFRLQEMDEGRDAWDVSAF